MSLKDKTIGLVTWDYSNPKGGMGRSLQWIADELRACLSGRQVVGCRLLVFTPTKKVWGGQIFFSFLLLFTLHRWMRNHAIHRLLLPVGPGGVFLLRKTRVKIASIVYHTYKQQSQLVPGQWWKKLFVPLERRTLRMSSDILCFAEDTMRVLVQEYGIAPEKIHLLPHAINLAAWEFHGEKDSRLCVCVARLEKRKGVDALMKAWPLVIEKIPDAKLAIVGQGVQSKNIDAAIKNIGSSVVRHSSLSQKEIQSLVQRASIALCPAYLEGFGLAAAEAMAAQCCMIASDTDGLRNLIDERTGILVKAGDGAALADAMIHALSHENIRITLGKNAHAWISEHCNPQTASAHIAAWAAAFVA